MIGMRRCLECGCKVRYVQMSPDVVLECQECGLKVVGISYLHLLVYCVSLHILLFICVISVLLFSMQAYCCLGVLSVGYFFQFIYKKYLNDQ